MQGGLSALKECLDLLEKNRFYRATCLGEPQLGRRGLYPTLGTRDSPITAKDLINVLAYADGTNDLIDLSDRTGIPIGRLYPLVDTLVAAGLLAEAEEPRVSA